MSRPLAAGRLGVALTDGPELFVWDRGGNPLFTHLCNELPVAVAVQHTAVRVVDSRGTLLAFGPNGSERERESVGDRVSDIVASTSDELAIVRPDGVVCAHAARSNELPVEGAQAACWSSDGSQVAVTCLDGRFAVMDREGKSIAVLQLDGRAAGLCAGWNGDWFVTVGSTVVRMARDGSAVRNVLPVGGRCGPPVVSGPLLAVPVHKDRVWLYDVAGEKALGSVTTRRSIVGATFVGPSELWVAVDDGEVARVELTTGEVSRVEAHRGRERATVALSVEFDAAAVRGALANARTGGKSVATFVPSQADSRAWWLGLGVIGGGVMLLCCGCGGVGALWKLM